MIVAPGNLQGWSIKELGSGGNWRLEGQAVHATYVAADEQWVDVGVWIERSDMAP
jgi:hypothetical protein